MCGGPLIYWFTNLFAGAGSHLNAWSCALWEGVATLCGLIAATLNAPEDEGPKYDPHRLSTILAEIERPRQ